SEDAEIFSASSEYAPELLRFVAFGFDYKPRKIDGAALPRFIAMRSANHSAGAMCERCNLFL
ncbi:MAG: hypothetical protein ACD_77C00407G0001, partial [uncultured bacterium]